MLAVLILCSVIIPLTVRLYFLGKIFLEGTTSTYRLAGFAICSQAVLAMAITTASIPILTRFLERFETGMLDIRNVETQTAARNMSISAVIPGRTNGKDGASAQSSVVLRHQRSQGNTLREHHGNRDLMHAGDHDIVITTELCVQDSERDDLDDQLDGMELRPSFE